MTSLSKITKGEYEYIVETNEKRKPLENLWGKSSLINPIYTRH